MCVPVHREEVYQAIQREIASGHKPRPKSDRQPLSPQRLSAVCQLAVDPFDDLKARAYFDALCDALGELVRFDKETIIEGDQAVS